jgi:Putative peptidoglycan binding domain
MSGISNSDYIRWVKASLNRLFGSTMPDNGSITPEYRMWVMALQANQKLPVTAKVAEAEQNAMIKLNRWVPEYVRWIQIALTISGEGVGTGGKAIRVDGAWGDETREAVKTFQINHEETLNSDGWVGAKTETTLMARTHTHPPGRPGGTRVVPKPRPWDHLLSDQDRVELMANMYKAELDAKAKGIHESQLSCLLSKMNTLAIESSLRFLSVVDVNHCIVGRFGEFGNETETQFVERFVKSNVKKEIMAAMTPLLKSKSAADQLKEYKKAVGRMYKRIQDGINLIQWKYAQDTRAAQDLRARAMFKWAEKRQAETSHVYSCFENLFE